MTIIVIARAFSPKQSPGGEETASAEACPERSRRVRRLAVTGVLLQLETSL